MNELIIFLDIDGVLVSHGNDYHPQCIVQLNRVTDTTQAVIVVSSSRRIDGLESMQTLLRRWGVTGNIVGITPDLSYQAEGGIYVAGNRGDEIRAWLREFVPRNRCTSFVILDDDGSGLDGFEVALVQTDYDTGLTKKDADRAIEILKGEI